MTLDATLTLPPRFRPVVLDLYGGIHKGIRAELFAVVGEAGRLDPADACGVVALAGQVRSVVELLEQHAGHEDRHVGPVIETVAPALAERIYADHHEFDARTAALVALADDVLNAESPRGVLHELYVDFAAFTGAYLLHQDVEEREINPTLEDAIGVEGMMGIHGAIIANMPPQDLIKGLAVMLPAMNVEDRTELLGGMKAGAPAEVFSGVWSLAGSVLTADDHRALARRLGLG